jgi:hypothetical protein
MVDTLPSRGSEVWVKARSLGLGGDMVVLGSPKQTEAEGIKKQIAAVQLHCALPAYGHSQHA